MNTVYDAIIVGSGATGGWAAKVLTEAGLKVLLLEAGPSEAELKARTLWSRVKWKLGYRPDKDARRTSRARVQSRCFAWADHPDAFVDDDENPYTTPEDAPFAWVRGRQVGGRMVVRQHGLHFYRLGDFDFRAASRDGFGDDWPITHAELAPYYEKVERWMSLRGNDDGVPHLPSSVYAAPITPTPGEARFKQIVEKRWQTRKVISRRTASPAKTLPSAQATGNLTLRANAVVSHLPCDVNTGKPSGVVFIDRRTGHTEEAKAKIVVLCASTLESTRILLNSKSRQHPEGLGNSSGTLGRYLMDHLYMLGMESRMPLPQGDQVPSPGWGYMPQFKNATEKSEGYLRGFALNVFTLGDACHLVPIGEMLPRAENRVTLDPQVKDRWGIPVLRIECRHSENELAMGREMVETCRELFREAGFEQTKDATQLATPGMAIHEVGTARMGKDPKTSVLNGWNQAWDAPNLFVMDGACFPSQGVQNPTLAMMALAVRASEYLVAQARRGEL